MWTGHIIGVNLAAAMIASEKKARAAGKTARCIWINHTLALGAEAGAAGAKFAAAHRQTGCALRTGKDRNRRGRLSTTRANAVLRRQD